MQNPALDEELEVLRAIYDNEFEFDGSVFTFKLTHDTDISAADVEATSMLLLTVSIQVCCAILISVVWFWRILPNQSSRFS